jgi:hypothetical protein
MTASNLPARIPTKTPAWVIRGIYQTLEVADLLLGHLGVSYTAICGTLLGGVRHGRIIPWDDDGDLAIRAQDLALVKEGAERWLRDRGFGFFKGWGAVGMMKIFPADGQRTRYPFHYPWVDIFPMIEMGGRWVYASAFEREAWPNDCLDIEAFDTVRRSVFGPIQLATVNDVIARNHLTAAYGPSWSIDPFVYGFDTNMERIPSEDPPGSASDQPLGGQLSRTSFLRRLAEAGFAVPVVMTFSEPWEDADLSDCYPRVARGLTWSETEGGFVVNRAGSSTPFTANGTGVLVLELANGRHSVVEIIHIVQETFALPNAPRVQVTEFLDFASGWGLVRARKPAEGRGLDIAKPVIARTAYAEEAVGRPVQCDDLEVNEVDGGLVIYQGRFRRVHYLNNTAALVFETSTGVTLVERIAEVLQEIFGLSAPPLSEVAGCVDELCELHLLRVST